MAGSERAGTERCMWGEERRDAVFTFGLVWRGWGCVGGALSGLEDVLLWVTWGDAPYALT